MAIPVSPEKGKVAFLWFNNYAGVTIRTPSKTLIIDPADVDPKKFDVADAVLITHEHYDHLDHAVVRSIYQRTKCMVIADPTSARRLRSVVDPDQLKEVNVGDEVELEGVKIRVEGCNHPPASTPVTFLMTSEDGIKIYHTADSLPFEEMKRISEFKPDLVFCTVGIAPGASPERGVEIAKYLQPKAAVPYHTASRKDLEKFAELLAKEASNIKCLIIEQGKAYFFP